MRFLDIGLFAAISIAAVVPKDTSPEALIRQIQQTYHTNTEALLKKSRGNCTLKSVGIRRAWDALSSTERQEYLNAVQCLSQKPALLSKSIAPGATNRPDDFTYIHINQTNYVHLSGLFLPWHRQLTWSYEKALREECGFTGYVPYWDWEKYSDNQAANPIFSASAFGGNGQQVPESFVNQSLPGFPEPVFLTRAPGTGGGCVTNGAFANLTLHLGPVAPANNTPNNTYGYQDNPRCLKRDFSQPVSSAGLSSSVLASVLNQSSVHSFHPMLEERIHPNAHSFVGADLFDFYSSPNDPVFFLLHSQIDRIWTLWQGQDYATRGQALDGTVTTFNDPPSENATLSTILHMGQSAGGDIPISQVMSAIGNEFCYVYA